MFKANWFDQIKTESFTRVLKNDVDGYKANQIMISVNALQVFIPIQNPTKKALFECLGFSWIDADLVVNVFNSRSEYRGFESRLIKWKWCQVDCWDLLFPL